MTAKQKAIELVDKFIFEHYATHEYAKKCALIAVDEILEALDESLIYADIEFYKSVKNEIEKL